VSCGLEIVGQQPVVLARRPVEPIVGVVKMSDRDARLVDAEAGSEPIRGGDSVQLPGSTM